MSMVGNYDDINNKEIILKAYFFVNGVNHKLWMICVYIR